MAEFEPVAKVDEIPDGGMRQYTAHGEPVGVYRVGSDVWAINDICSHEETYLSDGEFDVEDMEVECHLHGSRFDVRNGNVRILPATKPVTAYQVKIEGDVVLVGPPKEG